MSSKSTFSEKNLLPGEEVTPLLTLSDQSVGALMMALQKCLMEQSDITEILKNFQFKIGLGGSLYVLNPPIVRAPEEENG